MHAEHVDEICCTVNHIVDVHDVVKSLVGIVEAAKADVPQMSCIEIYTYRTVNELKTKLNIYCSLV